MTFNEVLQCEVFGERHYQKGLCVRQKLTVKFGCTRTVDDHSLKIFLENLIVLIQPTAKHYFVKTTELVQTSGMTTAKDNRKFCLDSVRILNEESAHSKRTKPLSVNCKHGEYGLFFIKRSVIC